MSNKAILTIYTQTRDYNRLHSRCSLSVCFFRISKWFKAKRWWWWWWWCSSTPYSLSTLSTQPAISLSSASGSHHFEESETKRETSAGNAIESCRDSWSVSASRVNHFPLFQQRLILCVRIPTEAFSHGKAVQSFMLAMIMEMWYSIISCTHWSSRVSPGVCVCVCEARGEQVRLSARRAGLTRSESTLTDSYELFII